MPSWRYPRQQASIPKRTGAFRVGRELLAVVLGDRVPVFFRVGLANLLGRRLAEITDRGERRGDNDMLDSWRTYASQFRFFHILIRSETHKEPWRRPPIRALCPRPQGLRSPCASLYHSCGRG